MTQNCPLCAEKPEGEFWRGRRFYAIDAGSDDFPAFIRIVDREHSPEMTALTAQKRAELRALLDAAEEEMIAALHPDKMNWAQFGNMVPHVHWHLIARWRDDGFFPECPWGPRQRTVAPEITAERRALAKALLPKLAARLSEVESAF
ncbi:HIT family protein [Sutterella sp.]|uniref:HIT family protein n=1 Tax=Sutterella sp. TaxID=1981025 RepID=UPI0026DFBF10|nr:HIT family protein [Sutterella sp.]MDO5530419.1 HIT family protein [Sutterella sp.]